MGPSNLTKKVFENKTGLFEIKNPSSVTNPEPIAAPYLGTEATLFKTYPMPCYCMLGILTYL
jgi:hypothetical protein